MNPVNISAQIPTAKTDMGVTRIKKYYPENTKSEKILLVTTKLKEPYRENKKLTSGIPSKRFFESFTFTH